jgi:hypothetical protein
LTHHFELFGANLRYFLLVLFLGFHLGEALAEHHHVTLG